MSGLRESGQGDLLKRATQAVLSRSAAADDDGADQIGSDTPRSGVATPQPDLHDKRLPGIMSYFNQVRPASFKRLLSGTFIISTGQAAAPPVVAPAHSAVTAASETGEPHHTTSPPRLSSDGDRSAPPAKPASHGGSSEEGEPPLLPHERTELSVEEKRPLVLGGDKLHPYPTPPASLRNSNQSDSSADREAGRGAVSLARLSLREKSSSSSAKRPSSERRASACTPLLSVVTPSSVHAGHFSNPTGRSAFTTPESTTPNSPNTSPPFPARNEDGAAVSTAFAIPAAPGAQPEASACVNQLKRLTSMARGKSGQSTPTRLSTAQPSRTEPPADEVAKENGSGIDRSDSLTPTPPGAQAPAPKGKLTIKISEARGLRKCKSPYVVAVFQRSELISGGPRVVEEDDDTAVANVAMGGIPIQRQGSDTGRAMAIPMRSRQSSNTSITDFTTFRNRAVRKSLTNPKWDAEAVFDVVDSNMLVDISVYDHTEKDGEEFLGHVDFQARLSEKDGPVRGWLSLKGHADTTAENTPTGEIYVEALYQRTDRKHYGPDDFQILRLIGKGTFGQVYQVRKKDTKRIYAMKVLSKKVIVQKKEVAHTVGERNILVRTATSDSPFIVGLKFSFQTPSDLYLVTDYMSGGELFWHLQKEGRFDEQRAKFYIAELILAIEHLHKNDIVYRDLKPENILLDANGHIALCDFGLSKANLTKNDTTNTFCGTTEYLAPEVLLDEAGYTKMVDFWSLGVLVFEMCCGWSPFYAEDTQQMYKNIAFGKVRFPKDTLSTEGRNFVKGLLNRNPKHRLGATKDAQELKEHPFFRDIDWDALSRKLITPPFKPKLKSETDVSYFDPEFTNALNTNGSLNERAAALARGFATSTPLSPSVQANFQGFTFVDESALDDQMRDRYKYEDEDMDDAAVTDRGKEDQDWDDINDIDPRKASRMSGIVRTTTNDEQMFGNSQFDM